MNDFDLDPLGLTRSPGALDFLSENDDQSGRRKISAADVERMDKVMSLLLYSMPDTDKVRVYMSCAKGTRNRKGIIRELSRVSNRSEKEIQSLTEQERGAIFVKRLAKFSASFVGSVIGAAIGAAYMAAAEQLMNRINTDAGNVLQRFQEARASVPDSLWVFLLSMVAQESTPQQQAAIEAIRYTIGESRLTTVLPFGVGDEPEMSKLEKYLLALHAKSPAEALPLISSLSEINPARPENWLLYGLAGLESQPPKTVQERAWWLTARLYLVGSDFTKSDKPMADAALGEPDVVKAIFTQQQLAGARKMIGEYLIRQLAMSKNFPLLLEVLPPEMVRSCSALTPIIVNEADEQASKGNIDQVRALVARFPEIKEHGVMATAFRRAGQFELAAKELENAKVELLGEKELIEARIANAFELVIPEDHDAQDQLFERLSDIEEAGSQNPEVEYCQGLYHILADDPAMAGQAFYDLSGHEAFSWRVRAYRFLAAILSRDSDCIEESLEQIKNDDIETLLASLPTNLLKTGVRALAAHSYPDAWKELTSLLYEHAPELLDHLIGIEEWLLTNPGVRRRFLDKQQNGDPIQRWAGYQKAIELAVQCNDPDLQAQAIDGCLSLNDPVLAPYQAQLLQEQVAATNDMDLKEELIERLLGVQPEAAKPHLYQLLHTYMGQHRSQDALRIVETLKEIGEDSEDLRSCAMGLRPTSRQEPAAGTSNGKLPRQVSVGFYGGDVNDRQRTDQLREDLMRKHPGLTIEFDLSCWNSKNLTSLVASVSRFDVIVASNLMRTTVSRSLRARARELGKVFGFCRNRGLGTIASSVLQAVESHLAHQAE